MKISSVSGIFQKGTCIRFALARNAMYAAALAMGIKKNDVVLTPAFDCDGALQPFSVLGCKLVFYRSNPYTFEADIPDLKMKLTSETKVIHVVNHFGLPQPWKELLKLRQETKIPILEDNAYSLFSQTENLRFGDFGDMSVFSLRKNLPLIDGGILRINTTAFGDIAPLHKARLFCATENMQVLNLLKRQLGWYTFPRKIKQFLAGKSAGTPVPVPLYSENGKIPSVPLRDAIGEEFSCDYLRPMSLLAQWQLSRFTEKDFETLADKKRFYYAQCSENLSSLKGIRVLWPRLPEGIVPFCSFLLVEQKRDALYEKLRARFDVLAWPTLPQLVLNQLDNFPEVKLLGRQLLQLNLPSDRVQSRDFQGYWNSLLEEIGHFAEGRMQ